MVADPVNKVMHDYVSKMEQMSQDLEIWEQANELVFSGDVEPVEYFNEFTAFPRYSPSSQKNSSSTKVETKIQGPRTWTT